MVWGCSLLHSISVTGNLPINYTLADNQFRLGKGNADDLDSVFAARLKNLMHVTGSVIAMLDRWNAPVSMHLHASTVQ